jgi:hypothetical protein
VPAPGGYHRAGALCLIDRDEHEPGALAHAPRGGARSWLPGATSSAPGNACKTVARVRTSVSGSSALHT